MLCRSLQWQYFPDTDTLCIDLVQATGLIDNSDDVTPGLLVDYAANNQLVALDVRMARTRVAREATNAPSSSQAAPLMSCYTHFDAEGDTLSISFVPEPSYFLQAVTEDDRILIWLDAHGGWESISILKAKECIATSEAANGSCQSNQAPSAQSRL